MDISFILLELTNKSKKQFDFIKNGFKIKIFEKYLKYLYISDTKTKLKLIIILYKALYNEKNPPELTGVLPADMVFVLNLKILNKIFPLYSFFFILLIYSKNVDSKLIALITGNISWR